MAKPILPEDLTAGMRAGVAAGKILDAKVTELASHADLLMAGDVAGIHDMRVAVKRLREALRLFRPLMPRGKRARVLALADEFNDALGSVRERDVLIEDARLISQQSEQAAEVLGVVLELWAEERTRAHVEAVAAWDKMLGRDRVIARLRRLAKYTRKRRSELNAVRLDQFAYYAILSRAERTRQRVAQASGTEDPAAMHRLRISVKRLKYTMEPFLTIFPPLAGPYGVVSGLQESLGLAQDAVVLESALQEYFEQRGLASSQGAQHVMEIATRRRQEMYSAAREQIGLLGDDWHRQLLDSID
jgi:triphosphatase